MVGMDKGKGKGEGRVKGTKKDGGDEGAAAKPRQELGGMTEREVRAVVEREAGDAKNVMSQFRQQIADVRAQLGSARAEVSAGARPTAGGVSYLELKLQLLLSYCTHLAFYLVLKAEGSPIAGHPVIEKLVEARTYMEKLRPMDAKLKYQMDKLLKTTPAGGEDAAAADALKFKPNPGALQLPEFGEERAGDEAGENAAIHAGGGGGVGGDDEPEAKPGIYRPPRINAMHFEDKAEAKKRREREKSARKAAKSDIVMALREEFDDSPMEVCVCVCVCVCVYTHSHIYISCVHMYTYTHTHTHKHTHTHTHTHTHIIGVAPRAQLGRRRGNQAPHAVRGGELFAPQRDQGR
jgi:U3 small nucleolar RNA-associated protein 3